MKYLTEKGYLKTIKSKKQINELFQEGKRKYGKKLTLIYREHSNGYYQYAILVGKKHGNSVQRNKIKRILRELMRELIVKETIPYCDVLICPYPLENKIKKYFFNAFKEDIIEWKNSLAT